MGITISNGNAITFGDIACGDCFQLLQSSEVWMRINIITEAGNNSQWNSVSLLSGKLTRFFDERQIYKCNVIATIQRQ